MQPIVFLLDAVISFFCSLFLLRFMMQAMRVSFAGQLGDFVVALTNWAVKPLRRLIPGVGGLDWSSLFAALALQLVQAGLIVGLSSHLAEADLASLAPMILWLAVRGLLRLAVYIMIGALILQAVLSWINPYSSLSAPAQQLTRPLLDPIRRFVPLISGIDLSPLIVILLLQLLLSYL
ncbi:MAG: YggT family protein [Candidatus Dechloromonas phosphoritropha]|jgi:YggT family protein|nr:YggT family protein [Candidatus Dechloromonas phosphoritropha]MBP8786924.1 YggT family protein [Azonexus sp.]MBP9227325.1 YggT family protein [Azonexus sp.]